MTTDDWLQDSTSVLKSSKILTARLDCLVLLEDATGRDRGWLLAHPEFELDKQTRIILDIWLAKRYKHIPLAYIRGRSEFYNHEFIVNEHTLVPRPESETIIELLKQISQGSPEITIADIGTGSGALAISAKLISPASTVMATDIDKECLRIAAQNATILSAEVIFLHGNLLEPLTGQPDPDLLLVNLPYVPDDFPINTAATHEPKHALFGGADGLDLYREMFSQIHSTDRKPEYILTESLPTQHTTLAKIAETSAYVLSGTSDFIQMFRYY